MWLIQIRHQIESNIQAYCYIKVGGGYADHKESMKKETHPFDIEYANAY